MKDKFKKILPILVFSIGILILIYPIASNVYYEKLQQRELEIYQQAAQKLEENNLNDEGFGEQRLKSELERCKKYNENLNKGVNLKDPFAENTKEKMSAEYNKLLDFDGDGKMGYLKIPVLDATFPIYHTTEEKVLQVGVGHLEGTSLPVGGKSTHAVLSAHNGLLDKKLFADLDKLINGDIFIINTIGEKIMYRVDKISVVLPEETEELKVVDGKDYVTLVTCTPYGENSHRLFVRGSRIEYDNSIIGKNERKIETSWKKEYLDGLKISIPIFLLFVLIKIVRDKIL